MDRAVDRKAPVRAFKRDHHLRYASFLFGAQLAALLIVGGPSYYFLNQNYAIFTSLAYASAPELLQHLEREQLWINMFGISAVLGVILFCLILGARIAQRFLRPIWALESHLRLLSRGHWDIAEIAQEESGEFVELIESYNYFYRSLRATNKDQLEKLMRISVDRTDRKSQTLLQELIAIKSGQLGQLSALNVETAPKSRAELRAS